MRCVHTVSCGVSLLRHDTCRATALLWLFTVFLYIALIGSDNLLHRDSFTLRVLLSLFGECHPVFMIMAITELSSFILLFWIEYVGSDAVFHKLVLALDSNTPYYFYDSQFVSKFRWGRRAIKMSVL